MVTVLANLSARNIYAIIQIVGVAIVIIELLYVSFQKSSDIQKHLIFILCSLAISFIGYGIELIGSTKEVSYVGICIGYVGKPFALFASLLLLLEYTNVKIPKPITLIILIFFVFLTTMVFTNKIGDAEGDYGFHKLYYSEVIFDPEHNIGSPISVGHGPLWFVYMISSFLIFGGYIALVVFEFIRSKTRQAKEMAIFLFLVVIFAVVGLALFITNCTNSFDSTLMGILIGSFFLLILLSKYRLFDSLTAAQRQAFDKSKDGYVITDTRNIVTFYNSTALNIIPILKSNRIRSDHAKIEALESFKSGEPFFVGDKVYSLSITKNTLGKKNKIIGTSYTFTDITEHHHYQDRLKADIERATTEIRRIQREAVLSFAGIVEARDGNTGEHIKNVSKYVIQIAKALVKKGKYTDTLTPEYIKLLGQCAPLHDVGKISVSDTILLKPGTLTDRERETMKTHTTNGAKLIEDTLGGIEDKAYTKTAKEIALYHHEWFNGNGYPKKLKGNKIPLSARIMAVADTYDALRMKRPYKEAFSEKVSIEIIKKECGTHFDPEIVEAFLSK